MHATITTRSAPTCVWMDAGVLNFKLCDRDFDCDNCPLNAALHGVAPVTAPAKRRQHAGGRREASSERERAGPS